MAKYVTLKINRNLFWASVVVIVIGVLGILSLLLHYFSFLRHAHSSFENYYAFRGCVKLLQKTDTFGTCKLADGSVIKLVLFNGRWYLDHDLPVCFGKLCL